MAEEAPTPTPTTAPGVTIAGLLRVVPSLRENRLHEIGRVARGVVALRSSVLDKLLDIVQFHAATG